jgi:hypothetical protein
MLGEVVIAVEELLEGLGARLWGGCGLRMW